MVGFFFSQSKSWFNESPNPEQANFHMPRRRVFIFPVLPGSIGHLLGNHSVMILIDLQDKPPIYSPLGFRQLLVLPVWVCVWICVCFCLLKITTID